MTGRSPSPSVLHLEYCVTERAEHTVNFLLVEKSCTTQQQSFTWKLFFMQYVIAEWNFLTDMKSSVTENEV